MEAVIETEPIFDCAEAAMRFAFNFRGTDFGRNALSEWIINKDDEYRPPSMGLTGNDGAAQAGMVLAEIDRLGRDNENTAMRAALICRYGVRGSRCSVCGGNTLAEEWRLARDELTEMVMVYISGISPRYMRRELVERHFGKPVQMSELAKKHDVSADTATRHYKLIHSALSALEESAMVQIEEALQHAGIVATT